MSIAKRAKALGGDDPATVPLQAGKRYAWCTCGLSKKQPFCDGAHTRTGLSPCVFTVSKSGPARLCTCKLTKTPPYCDASHQD